MTPTQYRTMHSQAQYNYTIEKYICTEKLHNANYMQAFDHMFITNTLSGSLQYDSVF